MKQKIQVAIDIQHKIAQCDYIVYFSWFIRWGREYILFYLDITSNFFDRIVACAFGQNLRKPGFYTHRTSIIVHIHLFNKQWLQCWHINFRQAFAEVRL